MRLVWGQGQNCSVLGGLQNGHSKALMSVLRGCKLACCGRCGGCVGVAQLLCQDPQSAGDGDGRPREQIGAAPFCFSALRRPSLPAAPLGSRPFG